MNKEQPKGTALVTGGAKRIGRAICLALSSAGYSVALHYNRSAKEAKEVSARIAQSGGRCELFSCDLGNDRQTAKLIAQVVRKYPDLNLLINNASVFEPSTIRDADIKTLRRDFAVNFDAPFILTAGFARHCRRGQIINILDTHIARSQTKHAAYLLSKKSLQALTRIAAAEFAPGIRVNAVAPGLILPPEDEEPEYLDRLSTRIPLQRKGDPVQVAAAVRFLLESPYITGETIFVDGGEHLV